MSQKRYTRYMDIGTRIIISMFFFSTLIILSVRYFKQRSYQMLASLFSVVWIVIVAGGEFTYNWAGNAMCSPYLGCVSGFFGYDAFEHFFFGVAALMILFWFCEKFPQHSLLPEVRWKRILISLALIALVAVSWEIVECAHDAIRADVFHESLRNFSLHINLLDQPTNLDTMGDLSFTLLGGCIGFFI